MAKSTEKTFDKLSAICLALPATQCTRSGDHATYRVRGKVFAYFLDDHHGDGIVSVCVKSELGENTDRARLDPERFYLPAYIGPRGWFGMRLDRGRVAWREVRERGRAQLPARGAEGVAREDRRGRFSTADALTFTLRPLAPPTALRPTSPPSTTSTPRSARPRGK